MKKVFFLAILCISIFYLNAQVGIGTPLPDSTAMLDVKSTTKGFLPPRMTTSQRNTIITPAEGLQIFNTTTNCLEFYVNGLWQPIACGCIAPPTSAPVAGVHVASSSMIVWNWAVVSGATKYKYNIVNNPATSTDNGLSTTFTQTGLTCTGLPKKLYVWAFNACGNGPVTTLLENLIFPVTISKAGTGTGTVTSVPAGINCGATCIANFACGDVVELTATPTPGSTFVGWSGGGCSGTGTCTTTITNSTAITANFTILTTLTVTKSGTGSGLITSTPTGINCGGDCTEDYSPTQIVSLNAATTVGSTFVGWSGGGCSGTGACSFNMGANRNVNANFTLNTYTLSTSSNCGGTVTSSPAGINCIDGAGTCSALFNHGTSVTLTATPAVGAVFTGWTGGCAGFGACVNTMTGPQSVNASFAYPVNITIANVTGGTGTVTSAPAGINCTSSCSNNFTCGSTVTLTATPIIGTFQGWTGGGCSGTGTCTVNVNAVTNVTATFKN
jgi:hypothetical protein